MIGRLLALSKLTKLVVRVLPATGPDIDVSFPATCAPIQC